MNYQVGVFFIGLLLEEDENRNHIRILRRNVRDHMNPFEYPDNQFIQLFRLDQQTTLNLINSLAPHIYRSNISLHLKVLATLNFVGTGSYQNPVGGNFCIGLSQASTSRAINEICTAISTYLLPLWIKFPTNNNEKNAIKQVFYQKWGLRGLIGVIEGTHVDIVAPPMTDVNYPPFVYINRKGKHSINVMLISDAEQKIIACSARYPGSVHDAAIWQMSSIKQYMRRNYEAGDTSFLIGDSGYPLEPWLFTPIQNAIEGTAATLSNCTT